MGYAQVVAFVLERWHWFAIAGLALTVWVQRGQVRRAKAARNKARAEVVLIKQGHERMLADYRQQVLDAQREADSRAVAASEWQKRYLASTRARRTPAPPECAPAVEWLKTQGQAVAW